MNRRGSSARLASYGRMLTPISPGGNALENDDSDDDGTEHANEDDIPFSYDNTDSSANFPNVSSCLV